MGWRRWPWRHGGEESKAEKAIQDGRGRKEETKIEAERRKKKKGNGSRHKSSSSRQQKRMEDKRDELDAGRIRQSETQRRKLGRKIGEKSLDHNDQ